jgi:hypothetical protein
VKKVWPGNKPKTVTAMPNTTSKTLDVLKPWPMINSGPLSYAGQSLQASSHAQAPESPLQQAASIASQYLWRNPPGIFTSSESREVIPISLPPLKLAPPGFIK